MSDSSPKLSKVISGNSQTAYERWQAPDVKSIEQRNQEKAGVLTARQLEALQKQAYDEGFQLGKDEGYQAGLQQGVEDGRQKGFRKGQEEVSQTVKHFAQIMKFLAKPIEQVNQTVKEELISLSMATAKQIIRREINVDPGQIIAVIKEALSALPSNSQKIKVYLHPSDAQIAREYLTGSSDEKLSEQADEVWSIIDEPNITRGGCQIKSESSQIDASIETRIAEIAARVLGSERAGNERAISEKVADTINESDSHEQDNSHELKELKDSHELENSHELTEEHEIIPAASTEEVKNDD